MSEAEEGQPTREEPKLSNSTIATTVDTRGMVCPYPSFETVKPYSGLNPSQVLEVFGEQEDVLSSVTRTLQIRNISYEVQRTGETWRIRVTKT